MPPAPSQEKGVYHGAKVTSRVISGSLLTVPIRFFTAIGSLFIVLVVLLTALLLTKLINDNYGVFQQKLREDAELRDVVMFFVNTLLGFANLFQKLIQFGVEIWNYVVPALNLAAYIFYRILLAVFLTIFGKGNQSNDAGDSAMPFGATPDPVGKPDFIIDFSKVEKPGFAILFSFFKRDLLKAIGTLTGGVSSFLNFLECILIDWLTLMAGMFKVLMRALGAVLVVVFNWLDQNLQMQWYRKEYCRMGAGYGDNWSTTTDPNNPSTTLFDNGSGPGNTCPDNSALIQGLIRFFEMVVNLIRDIFIFVFPIVADLLKMIFDALLKILPQIMEGLVQIIELFSPDQPLGKILMFVINFMIQVLGFFIRSCVLQLVISIVMCFFNVAIALVTNVIHAIVEGLANIVCLGGHVCDPDVPGGFVDFPSCDWSSFTTCVQQNYDSQQRNVSAICQIPSCNSKLNGIFNVMHKKMKSAASRYSNPEEYQLDYYKSCLETHAKGKSNEETVEGHMFCRYLTEEVHKPVPLGIDPSEVRDPFNDGGELCEEVQQSCVCRYNSPICESETCCLTFYNILVQQTLADMEMQNCDVWDKKYVFAQAYCISRSHRSLQLETKDLLGTATHCDGFVNLLNQTCDNKPPGTLVDVKGIVGGMCNWVDKAGFCNEFRRPNKVPEGLGQIAAMYNDHLRDYKEQKKKMMRSGTMMGLDPQTEQSPFPATSPFHYMDHFNQMNHMIEDHYDVAFHVISEAFPILRGMLIQKSFEKTLGTGQNEAILNPDIHLSDGRFRTVRREENPNWKDYNGEKMLGINMQGGPEDWHYLGSHGDGGAYTPDSGCTDETGAGYPGHKSFTCQQERMGQTATATGGSITNLVGPGMAQDKVDTMVSNSSQPIYNKTTTRPTFATPTNQYSNIMYSQDMNAPSHWTPTDATRTDQNPNWRIPFTTKNTGNTDNRPPGFTVYGAAKGTQEDVPLDQCPVPVNFPWEKVFKQRKTFLSPLQAFIQKIPEWTDENIPDVPNLDIPSEIR